MSVRTVRRVAVVLASLLVGALVIGCGSEKSRSSSSSSASATTTTTAGGKNCSLAGKKIQLVGPLKSNPVLQIMAAGFSNKADKLGFDSQVLLAEDANPQNVIALGKQALVQGSDGMVILAGDPAFYPFIKQVAAKGIPVIVTHFPIETVRRSASSRTC